MAVIQTMYLMFLKHTRTFSVYYSNDPTLYLKIFRRRKSLKPNTLLINLADFLHQTVSGEKQHNTGVVMVFIVQFSFDLVTTESTVMKDGAPGPG